MKTMNNTTVQNQFIAKVQGLKNYDQLYRLCEDMANEIITNHAAAITVKAYHQSPKLWVLTLGYIDSAKLGSRLVQALRKIPGVLVDHEECTPSLEYFRKEITEYIYLYDEDIAGFNIDLN